MPYDDKSDGTFGRRGFVLIIDAPGVIAHLQTILDVDLDPTNHREICRGRSIILFTAMNTARHRLASFPTMKAAA